MYIEMTELKFSLTSQVMSQKSMSHHKSMSQNNNIAYHFKER